MYFSIIDSIFGDTQKIVKLKFKLMNLKNYFLLLCFAVFTFTATAQKDITPNVVTKAHHSSTITDMVYVPSIASRMNEITPAVDKNTEALDRRSLGNQVVIGKDSQTEDDYLASNPHPSKGSFFSNPPSVVFDAYTSNSQPTDPSVAIGPNHVFVVFNTGFTIYDKSGAQLLGQTSPNPAIFPSSGCCDLTVSYDQAADRWVVSFLGGGAQVAISDGPDPINDGWNVYNVAAINDYQKLSVWSDGYYITDNASSTKLWVLERDAMIAGNSAGLQGFTLPGIVTSGFNSAQALNVSDDNMPAAGGAIIMYMQDDAWGGVTTDHMKLWTVDMDWGTPGNSTISAAQEVPLTPFISVFDGGSFVNLAQPTGGTSVDALQATIMNQAQFRKFAGHNSAIFNFVVDTDAGGGELAGVRWMEFRQAADNTAWSLYQEGTYVAPDGRHAWHASMIMDGSGNIGMGYTSMSGPTTPTTVRISSYYTGRFDGDPLGTMTVNEELISAGNANIPSTRYGDYSKIDIDPSDDATFWFINEYFNSGRKGVVGAFQLEPNTTTNDIGVTNITSPVTGLLTNSETITVSVRNYGINDISDPQIQYTINGGAAVTQNLGSTLSAETTESFTFTTTADLSAAGDYVICAQTNLGGDSNGANDEFCKTVTNGVIYCDPGADCSFGDGFTLVSVEEINNTSGCEGYADFTDQEATLNPGNTYSVTFTTGYGDQNVKGWIDFNDDGNFETSEIVVPNFIIAPGEAAGVFTETLDLVVPSGVTEGAHRMRFKSNWQADVPNDACEETQYGETEDYTANVGSLSVEDLSITQGSLIVTTLPNKQFGISLTTEFDGIASIAIYDILGRTLAFNNLQKEGASYNYDLDMSYAASGVYLIKIGDQDSNTYKSAKIIVK
ncbi:MAG: hypothetical protein ACI9SJ_000761 [Flavobacteriaceae bacterium]